MIAAVLWVAGGALLSLALLVCFTAWLRLLDDDSNMRHGLKDRCHHKSHD